MKKVIFSSLIVSLLFSSCLQFNNQYTGFPPGIWRGVLKLEQKDQPLKTRSAHLDADPNLKFEEVTQGELPFIFEVIYDTKDKFHLEIINANERIRLDDIRMGRDRRTGRDTFRIMFPEYQNYLVGAIEGGVIQGKWVVPSKADYSIPFSAKFGQSYRFTTLQKAPTADISGNWETTFGVDAEAKDQEKAIGQFKQSGNQLTGTFATETGDYRYLQGEVQANKFYLSCFDGAHAFLFEGKIVNDNALIGAFQSGKNAKSIWEAKRNENFKLREADKITQIKNTEAKISFQNPDGKVISLQNPEYQGKVKILQIMGTWCPNCKDETRFLSEYTKNNPNVAVIGLAFERNKEKEKANAILKNYKNAMQAPYEFVVAGSADKDEAGRVLPFLDKIAAFPTTVYIDKHNKIRKIYTGFYGPATNEFGAFKTEFETFVKGLENEK